MNIESLLEIQRAFVKERDWEKFHTPKNLSTALVVEASELAEIFQWMTAEESAVVMQDPKKAEALRDELADVFFFVLRLSDKLGIPLEEAFQQKMKKNTARYPKEWAMGHAKKYTERES